MVARVLIVLAGYLMFSVMGDDRLAAGIVLWAGVIFLGWYVIDLITRQEAARAGAWRAAAGVVLVAAGIVLALTP